MAKKVTLTELFAKWTRVDPQTGCIEWVAARTPKGYGVMSSRRVHRVAWELAHGPIQEGLFVCHRCDNPPCCNVEHLFLGTAADNAHDRDRKGRTARRTRHGTATHPERLRRGESTSWAKLTASAVVSCRVRRAKGEPIVRLAEECGVTKATMRDAITGRTWKHL